METTPRIRILTTGGKQPEIRRALETPHGIVFEDTLGKRWRTNEVISYWIIETKETSK